MAVGNRYSNFSYLIKISLVACLALGLAACDSSESNHHGSNTIDSIELSSDRISLIIGSEAQLTLMAKYKNGDAEAVTDQAMWQSDDANVVSVNDVGIISGLNYGTAMITAILDGHEASIEVMITDPEITSLQLTADTQNIIVGLEAILTLRAFLSDGSSPVIADDKPVEWRSSNPSVAEVNAGTVIGLSEGAVTITAEFDSHEARTVIQVKDAQLTNIQLTPHELEVIVGAHGSLTLTGFYDNNESYDVTHNERVLWKHEDDLVATVDDGKVTGVAVGETTVEVEFDGHYASVSVTVFDIQSVAINCDKLDIVEGLHAQCELIASYTHGSMAVITDNVTWDSKDENIIVYDDGRIDGIAPGTANITAEFQGHKANKDIYVLDATITGLQLECLPGCELIVGLSTELKLMALLDNNTQQVVTDASWHNNNEYVATVEKGEVVGVDVGSATITATVFTPQGPIQDSIDITVIDATLTGIELSAEKVGVVIDGLSVQLTLWALYDNGNKVSVTDQADWLIDRSAPSGIATVTKGQIDGVEPGKTEINANFEGMLAKVDVDVVDEWEGVTLTVTMDADSNGEVNFLDENGFVLQSSCHPLLLQDLCELSGIYKDRKITLEAVPDNIANFDGWDYGTATSCDDYDDSNLCHVTVNDFGKKVTVNFDTPMTRIFLITKRNYGPYVDGYINLPHTSWRTGAVGGDGNVCGNHVNGSKCTIEVPAKIGTLTFRVEFDPKDTFIAWWLEPPVCVNPYSHSCIIDPLGYTYMHLEPRFK